MKRIATIAAALAAGAVAVPVATAGNEAQRSQPRVVGIQVAHVQVARVQRAQAAVTVQRHLVQVSKAKRFSVLRVKAR